MHDCDEDEDYRVPPRRWTWVGLGVELFKPAVGVMRAAYVLTEAFRSMGEGIYGDLAAHYNWKLQQNEFRDAVVRDLEYIREM